MRQPESAAASLGLTSLARAAAAALMPQRPHPTRLPAPRAAAHTACLAVAPLCPLGCSNGMDSMMIPSQNNTWIEKSDAVKVGEAGGWSHHG